MKFKETFKDGCHVVTIETEKGDSLKDQRTLFSTVELLKALVMR